jgi:hypothetical protein
MISYGTLDDIAEQIDAKETGHAKRGPYKRRSEA